MVAFAVLSVPVVWVSKRSLLHPSSHGFSRFFAFEAILALVVLNGPRWFVDPLGALQLGSWLLLCASLVSVAWGFRMLRRHGDFSPAAESSATFGWENTGRLVTTGIYRYIRHPMYASLLFLAWGAVLKSVAGPALLLGAAATLALFATAKAEEAENLARFGQEYRDYMARTRRFVPFLL
ncbi:MAG: isoprenylcysteine carboxylmethyltransferase family protein [Gemmatimonadota bacterium]|jgi:protein-S-isoprenylcysteine O-methyltransferase Ste14